MSFVSDPAKSAGPRLLALVLLLAAAPLLCATAYAREPIRITITLRVVDSNGKPIPRASVSISRDENVGNYRVSDLNDKADSEGKFKRENVDFLIGPSYPHKLIIEAEGYVRYEQSLSEEELRVAFSRGDNSLNLGDIGLEKGSGANSGNVNAQVANTNTAAPVGNGNSPVGNVNAKPPTGSGLSAGLSSLFGLIVWLLSGLLWWLGALTALGLVGFGVAWVFGYRVPPRTDVIPNGNKVIQRDGSSDIYLRGIEEKLVAIDEKLTRVDAAINKKQIKEPGQGKQGGSPEQNQDGASIKQLFKQAFRELYGDAVPHPPAISTAHQPSGSKVTQGGWPVGGGHDATAKQSATAQPAVQPIPQPQSERACVSYRSLLDGQPTSPEPLHLDSEGTSSVSGKLEDGSVYLKQVGHTQGTFVLFTEDGKAGYVFPNPALAFQGPALREVFPALTEAEFNGAKQRIEPVPVIRVGERKWKVGDGAQP